MVHQAAPDVVKPILEKADRFPAMLQNPNFLGIFMYMYTNKITPRVGNHDDGEKGI